MREYDVFGARIMTVQSNAIAVVGLCLEENTGKCEVKLQSLDKLCFDTKDPTEIDLVLADRLSELYTGCAVAIGASACIGNIYNQVFRTGGVLGRPEAAADDAENELEQLDDGIWMYTISGGPGWIGFFSQSKAQQLAGHTFNHSVAYPVKVNEIYRDLTRLSPDSYIFVSDGTGYDSFGICAAKHGSKEIGLFV